MLCLLLQFGENVPARSQTIVLAPSVSLYILFPAPSPIPQSARDAIASGEPQPPLYFDARGTTRAEQLILQLTSLNANTEADAEGGDDNSEWSIHFTEVSADLVYPSPFKRSLPAKAAASQPPPTSYDSKFSDMKHSPAPKLPA